MTRETKVGLVVCCSFLCLVGVVLACKLRGDGDQADADGQNVAEETVAEPASPPIASLPASPTGGQEPSGSTPVPKPPSRQPASSPLAPVKPGEELKLTSTSENHDASQLGQAPGGSTAAPSPAAVLGVKQDPPVTPAAELAQESGSAALESVVRLPAQDTLSAPQIAGIQWSGPTSRLLVAVPWPLSAKLADESPGSVATSPSSDATSTGSGASSTSAPAEQVASATSAGSGSSATTGVSPIQPPARTGEPDLIEPPPPPPSIAKGSVAPVSQGTETASSSPSPAQDSHTQAPGAALMSPVVASALGASGSERHEGSQGGVMPPPASAHVPSADDGPERHVSAPSAPMSGATPPIGTPPTAVTPPIAVPTPGGPVTPRVEPASSPPAAAAPKVEVFDEETYLCQPGDTFDKISQAHYHTENYAKALLQFNIDHPLANDKVRRNPPVLEPGQAVYIPPTRILESRYGAFYIPGYKPAQQQSAAPGSALPARNDHSANASPGVAANTSAVYPQYRVQGQGETMREIARATLGSAERWSEIYKLNPDYRPEFRVPGGTALRLPSDARVDPANVAR